MQTKHLVPFLASLLFGVVGPAAVSQTVEPATPTQLRVFPEEVRLDSARDFQRVIVQEVAPDGSTVDLTETARLSIADPRVCDLDRGFLIPVGNGSTRIRVEANGQLVEVPVSVSRANEYPPLSFRNEVLAVLTRAGCNTGKCHGSASGKDGFRLSLYGYDPEGDHDRLTKELAGRRINLALPEKSLLIQKAMGEVYHTGGQLLSEGDPHCRLLLSWLKAGASGDTAQTPAPIGISVGPSKVVAARRGEVQELAVTARYSDGTDRDVTDLSVFLSNNDAAATVTADGFVTSTGAGSAFILARYDEFTGGTEVIVRPSTEYQFPDLTPANYIDEHVFSRWRELHLSPSDLCSDEVFLRRAYVDLIGLLPTPEQQQQFLTSEDPDKRAQVVGHLLQDPAFRDMWIMKWAELLQIRSINGIVPKGLQLYDRWLRDQIHAGVPINEVVREVLGASGGTFENPAVTYFQTETTPQLLAENVAQAFLGTRIQCAQCHNHPFDRWTMDDYYGFATFFSRVAYKQAQDPREVTVYDVSTGGLDHPIAGRKVIPAFLGSSQAADVAGGQDAEYRRMVADWLTSPENTALSRNLANLVWAHFNGVGIVEPVDDFRVSNPPSNPELLEALAARLVEYRFDISKLARDICLSRTYQLSSAKNASNEWDTRNFSHATLRRLRAEVLLDCMNLVTETSEELPGLPNGGRAIQVPDGRALHYFLNTFGRASRQTPCSCEVQTSPTLSQALHLLNGETTTGKIEQGKVVQKLLDELADPMQVVDSLYVRTLCRRPTAAESRAIRQRLSRGNAEEQLQDLFWALLNSNEFTLNH